MSWNRYSKPLKTNRHIDHHVNPPFSYLFPFSFGSCFPSYTIGEVDMLYQLDYFDVG